MKKNDSILFRRSHAYIVGVLLACVVMGAGAARAVASTLTCSWDNTNLLVTTSGDDNDGISSITYEFLSASSNSDTSGSVMNSGAAHHQDANNAYTLFGGSGGTNENVIPSNTTSDDVTVSPTGVTGYTGWVLLHVFTSPSFTNERFCWFQNPAATPTPTPTPFVPASGNTYIFLIVGLGIFLLQLLAVLVIFYLAAMLIGWPIKKLMRDIILIIKRGGRT